MAKKPLPPTTDSAFTSRLQAAKTASWAQVLFKCARLINEQALTKLQRRTGQSVRPSHTALFPYIDLAGTRPSVLAQKLGISKQAISQSVEELETMGIVERVADPRDARAHLVRFSPKGRKGLLAGLALLGEMEANLAQEVGAEDVHHMHQTLLRLLATLEAR